MTEDHQFSWKMKGLFIADNVHTARSAQTAQACCLRKLNFMSYVPQEIILFYSSRYTATSCRVVSIKATWSYCTLDDLHRGLLYQRDPYSKQQITLSHDVGNITDDSHCRQSCHGRTMQSAWVNSLSSRNDGIFLYHINKEVFIKVVAYPH